MKPKLLIAGHIVKDVTGHEWRPGGGVLYAAAQANKLGGDVAVVTAFAEDVDPCALLPDVAWKVQESEVTTSFENRYEDGRRTQRLLATGRPIDMDALPEPWLLAPIVLLTPLFHEIDPDQVGAIAARHRLVGVAAQGWLRELDGDRVIAATAETAPAWLAGDVVFVSEEDVAKPDSVAGWQEHVSIVALTRGRGGCTVWDASGRHEVSGATMSEKDPTGAGDVFAAAFLIRYEETRDAIVAARFATAAGALSIRGVGFEAVAGRDEIEALLAQGQVKVA